MTYLETQGWKDILAGSPVAPAAYQPASSTYYSTLKDKGMGSVADTVNYILNTPTKGAIRFMAPWSTKANDVITANWNDMLNGKKPNRESIIEPTAPRTSAVPPAGKPRPRPEPGGDIAPPPQA